MCTNDVVQVGMYTGSLVVGAKQGSQLYVGTTSVMGFQQQEGARLEQ